jgi:hypothetical protein
MGIPYDYQTDWTRIGQLIVHDALRLAPGERVLIHADPTYFPALTEAVRIEIARARGVELAAHMLHPPGLERVRRELRRREDPALREMEDGALSRLFELADVYVWLPTSWAYNVWQTEEIIKTWPGRAVHFHWIMDRLDGRRPLPAALGVLRRGALIDYAALTAHQRRLAELLRDSEVEVTDPRDAPPLRPPRRPLPPRERRRLEAVHRRLRTTRERSGSRRSSRPRGHPTVDVQDTGSVRCRSLDRRPRRCVADARRFGRQRDRPDRSGDHHLRVDQGPRRVSRGYVGGGDAVARHGRCSMRARDIMGLRRGSDPVERGRQRGVGRPLPLELPPVVLSD